MEHGTTRLLGLEGLAVVRVDLDDGGGRIVHVVTADPAAVVCPSCGASSTSVKQNAVTRPKDLPYGPATVKLLWHKRRWRCRTIDCARRTFTETVPVVPPRGRTTVRLRHAVAEAVGENRCVAEVARSHRGVLAHGAAVGDRGGGVVAGRAGTDQAAGDRRDAFRPAALAAR